MQSWINPQEQVKNKDKQVNKQQDIGRLMSVIKNCYETSLYWRIVRVCESIPCEVVTAGIGISVNIEHSEHSRYDLKYLELQN